MSDIPDATNWSGDDLATWLREQGDGDEEIADAEVLVYGCPVAVYRLSVDDPIHGHVVAWGAEFGGDSREDVHAETAQACMDALRLRLLQHAPEAIRWAVICAQNAASGLQGALL